MSFDPEVFDPIVFANSQSMAADCLFDADIFDSNVFDACEDTPAVVVDTHDGFDSERKYYRRRIEARERLRTQIEEAFGSPKRLARAQQIKPAAPTPAMLARAPRHVDDDDEDWLLLI